MSGLDGNTTVGLQDLRAKLYDLLGQRYSAVSPSPGALILLQAANMLPSTDTVFQGRGRVRGVGFNGQRFSVQEVRTEGASAADGFDGLIVSVSQKLSIFGRTIILPKRGDHNARHIDGMKRVTLDHTAFDTQFDVYADNQIEGRSLIRADFMKGLLGLSSMFGAHHASVAFAGRQMHVVLPTGDRLRISQNIDFTDENAAADHVSTEMVELFELIAQIDALLSSADRHCPIERVRSQIEYYLLKTQSIAPMIKTAMDAGIMTDSRRAKHVAREAALSNPALIGHIMSRA